jgi:hypothetical protein
METIKTLLDQNCSPPYIAAFLDTTVERVVEEMKSLDLLNWGDEKLYRYIIARRLPGEWRWHQRDMSTLFIARVKHDEGFVTMMQLKDQGYLIQYALPADVDAERRRLWFTAPPETY